MCNTKYHLNKFVTNFLEYIWFIFEQISLVIRGETCCKFQGSKI